MKKKKAKAKSKAKASKKSKSKKSAKAKKSPAKKRPAKKKAVKKVAKTPKPGVIAPAHSVLLGFVEDYYAKIGVIALTLKAPVLVGQKIQVLGHTTHIDQTVGSMQIEHAMVDKAGKGDGVGIKVNDRARSGDHVYLLK
jgi:hypothetical protein